LRVAMFVTGFPIPSETFILDQISGLARRGCDITIFAELAVTAGETQADDVVSDLARRTHVPTVPAAVQFAANSWRQLPWKSLNVVRYGRKSASLRLFSEAIQCQGHAPFDVVHCHFGPNGIRAAALREIGAIKTRALITSFYGYDLSEFIRGPNPYSRLFRQGELFLPLSEKMRDRLIAIGCPEERILIQRLGVASADFPASSSRGGAGPVRIVSVARLVEKKGIEFGIRAVARLAEAAVGGVQYTIVGDGPLRPVLERMIRSLGMQDAVVMAGWRDRAAVRTYLAEADILLAPSVTSATGDEEGTPTAILEAMASGLPVVSTFHAGIPELVKDGVSGMLVRERDVEATAAAVSILVQDLNLRRSMGLTGRAFVSERHDIERLNGRLLEIYREQTDGKPTSRDTP
jgi:colanic acid/amylovoran biosynthesis glycosyltransferase